MKVGSTGTQYGITQEQREKFKELILKLNSEDNIEEFHDGNCKGSDLQTRGIVLQVLENVTFHIHPSTLNSFVKPYTNRKTLQIIGIHPVKKPLVRNRDIVDCIDVLIGCPYQKNEIVRSGTWATIRYAKKQNKKTYIIKPNGEIENELL